MCPPEHRPFAPRKAATSGSEAAQSATLLRSSCIAEAGSQPSTRDQFRTAWWTSVRVSSSGHGAKGRSGLLGDGPCDADALSAPFATTLQVRLTVLVDASDASGGGYSPAPR